MSSCTKMRNPGLSLLVSLLDSQEPIEKQETNNDQGLLVFIDNDVAEIETRNSTRGQKRYRHSAVSYFGKCSPDDDGEWHKRNLATAIGLPVVEDGAGVQALHGPPSPPHADMALGIALDEDGEAPGNDMPDDEPNGPAHVGDDPAEPVESVQQAATPAGSGHGHVGATACATAVPAAALIEPPGPAVDGRAHMCVGSCTPMCVKLAALFEVCGVPPSAPSVFAADAATAAVAGAGAEATLQAGEPARSGHEHASASTGAVISGVREPEELLEMCEIDVAMLPADDQALQLPGEGPSARDAEREMGDV